MHTSKLAELTATVTAMNLCHTYANKLMKMLREHFEQYVGQKIVKADGTLLKKIADKLPAFPEVKGNPGQHEFASIQVYKNSSDYTLGWTVKVCQPMPETCIYYENTLCIGNFGSSFKSTADMLVEMPEQYSYERKTDFEVVTVIAAIENYEEKKKAADEAKSELYMFDKFIRNI